MPEITVINPLGSALAHYERALSQTLATIGCPVRSKNIQEPSARGGGIKGRVVWVVSYMRAVRQTRQVASGDLISTWPVLGYWDCCLLAMAGGGRRTLIVHDPEPLVKAVGYGRVARFLARHIARNVEIMVHSERALEVVVGRHGIDRVRKVEHPMFEPRSPAGEAAQGGDGIRSGVGPTVRVLGQFKTVRDTGSLERIAREGNPEWTLEIVGRGWPDVEGWSTRSEFVSDAEFERLLGTADVLLIPYEKFFQSGVAIRALELKTPVVGPADSSLSDLLGSASNWLVRDDGWTEAIANALGSDPEMTKQIATAAHVRSVSGWKAWSQPAPGF